MAMVSCPKCGFTQPADQYCANCGVDMQAWKPREKPFFIRLTTNPVFQVIVVTIVVMVTFVYMRENRKRELAAHVRAIEIARQAEEVDQSVGEQYTPRKTRAQTTSASTADQAPVPQAPPAPQPVAAAAPSSAPLVAGSITGGSASSSSPKATASLKLTYYEVARNLLSGLLANAQQPTSEGPLTMGVVSGFEQRMSKGTVRELDSANQSLQVNQPALVFRGARSQTTGANVGFTVQVNPIAIDDNGAQIQIDIARVLATPEAAGGVDETTFAPSETFSIPKGSALVVAGLLPHRTPSDTESNFYKTVNVLRPMTSPPFLAGQSEAVLIIEVK